MKNKKYQIFISSTYKDLIDERQEVVQTILKLHHIPAGMELFNGGDSQWETIKKWIDESDVYILILGGRYGSIDPKRNLSYTELEYRYALQNKKPAFTVVLTDDFIEQKKKNHVYNGGLEKDIIEVENKEKYNDFKTFVMDNTVVRFVKNLDCITGEVAIEISAKEKKYELKGWTKGENNNNILLNKIDVLVQENEKLKKEKIEINQEILDNLFQKSDSIEERQKELEKILNKIFFYQETGYQGTYTTERVIFNRVLEAQDIKKTLINLKKLLLEDQWSSKIKVEKFWKNIPLTYQIENIPYKVLDDLKNIYTNINSENDEVSELSFINTILEEANKFIAGSREFTGDTTFPF
ncbi:MAG: DUF4062 domain-containing protein [Bacilli bacterium]